MLPPLEDGHDSTFERGFMLELLVSFGSSISLLLFILGVREEAKFCFLGYLIDYVIF